MRPIFFDIETVAGIPADPSSFSAPSNYKDMAKIKAYQQEAAEKANAKGGLDYLRGQVVVCCVAAVNSAPTALVGTEDEIVASFAQFVAEDLEITSSGAVRFVPEWVGFNLRDFDMAWMRLRLLRNVVRGISPRECRNVLQLFPQTKYDKVVWDLRDYLTGYAYQGSGTLQAFANFMGLPCDDKFTGADVQGLWDAGRLDDIVSHCCSDVSLVQQFYKLIRAGGMD